MKESGTTRRARMFLQRVIANLIGGIQGRLDIAGLDEVVLFLTVMCPHAGQIIGLKLKPDGNAIGLPFIGARRSRSASSA